MRNAFVTICLVATIAAAVAADEPKLDTPPPESHGGVMLPPGESPMDPVAKGFIWPLANMPRMEVADPSLDAIAKRLPHFRHRPFDTAGFNPTWLPFRTEPQDDRKLRLYANAMSFLVSNDLDWVPGNYCSRHAYFVFRSEGNRSKTHELAKSYQPAQIVELIDDWSATHAVGGVLRRDRDGFSGELEIFGSDGRRIFHKVYKRPRTFFRLLGDISADAMKHFGHQPSEAMVKHLRRTRCQRDASLERLGQAAEDPESRFIQYGRILAADPGFADVRYWNANQSAWARRGHDQKHDEFAKALDSYPVCEALATLDPTACEPQVAARLPKWLADAEKLGGPHCPPVMRQTVAAALRDKRIDPERMPSLLAYAARYPNNFQFVRSMANVAFLQQADYETASGLYITALQSRYLDPMSGLRHRPFGALGCGLGLMGKHDLAAGVSLEHLRGRIDRSQRTITWTARNATESLFELGRFDEAIQIATVAMPSDLPPKGTPREQEKIDLVLTAGVCAALQGDTATVQAVIDMAPERLRETGVRPLLHGYLNAPAGKPVNTDMIVLISWSDYTTWIQATLFCAQMDLLRGQSRYEGELKRVLRAAPQRRTAWYLMDQYDRRDPDPSRACFYDTLVWLHPDDPWVRQAAADFRKRVKTPTYHNPAVLEKRLADVEPVRWAVGRKDKFKWARTRFASIPPWAVAGAAQRLARDGHHDRAEALVQRYMRVAADAGPSSAVSHTHQILHRLKAMREAAMPAPSTQPER